MQDIKHDLQFYLAIGRDRNTKNWKNRDWLWSEFLRRIEETHRTAETYAEYMAASKERQDEIKDVGGYVGGYLAGGRRLKGRCMNRQLITLDLDHDVSLDVWDEFKLLYGCAAALYTTHKHSPDKPRLRLLVPLAEQVDATQYEAIARKIAGSLDIEMFDVTTFQPERLMYWPSTSKNAEYIFHHYDAAPLNPQIILDEYFDWSDASEWPVSIRIGKVIQHGIDKQGDPLEKPGIIGAYCRTYPISRAITEVLHDVYEPASLEDRYTYKKGSTGGGLVVYDDKYAFSHHGTDPISGKLCNAFDLVRLHKFGIRDEDAKEGTPFTRLPSYLAMTEFAAADEHVRVTMGSERLLQAREDFKGLDWSEDPKGAEQPGISFTDTEPENTDWMADLEADKRGNFFATIDNIVIILENDPYFRGRIGFDEFEKCEVALQPLPWRKDRDISEYKRRLIDRDDSSIRRYLEKVYKISAGSKITDAQAVLSHNTAFHPIRDYLDSMVWDGVPRLDTLFIDYLGAEDCPYVRAVARKTMCAAVGRIFHPGIKFDYVTTFIGPQGRGKSTLASKMGGIWFTDGFNAIQGNASIEQLQGVWIVEMGELAGLKKADIDVIKAYVSRRTDRYRVAYGKRVESFPRQCIFVATTNRPDFMRDTTGGRRFWPIVCGPSAKSVFDDLDEDTIKQVWAEAVRRFEKQERLYLPAELEKVAAEVQQQHTEADDRAGIIERYLEAKLPANWNSMNPYERRAFIDNDDGLSSEGIEPRTRVCAAEIWVEALGGNMKDVSSYNTKFIHDIMRNLEEWEAYKTRTIFGIYGNQTGYYRCKQPKNVTLTINKLSTTGN